MDIFVKYNKRRTMISLESKSNEDNEIVIEKFLDYLKSSNLSNEAWIRKGKNEFIVKEENFYFILDILENNFNVLTSNIFENN